MQLAVESHVRPAMMYLAAWIYSTPELQSGVTETKLVDKTTEYLCQKRFEDRDDAESAAREFIGMCRGRKWVFSDVGTTPGGEHIYQFTHRTFLEYFSAKQLTRLHHTPDNLGQVLFPRIAKSEWDVVSQIAFQILNNQVEGAGDKLLEELVDRAETEGEEAAFTMLHFAARCLEFMVPSPRIVRKIVTACLEHCAASALSSRDSKAGHDRRHDGVGWEPAEILQPFSRTGKENLGTLIAASGDFIEQCLEDRLEARVLLACELLEGGPFQIVDAAWPASEFMSPWNAVTAGILHKHQDRISDLARRHWLPCTIALRERMIKMQQAIDWHGLPIVFRRYNWSISGGPSLSYTEGLSRQSAEDPGQLDAAQESLTYLGNFALAQTGPLITRQQCQELSEERRSGVLYGFFLEGRSAGPFLKIGSDGLFGAIALLLTGVELDAGYRGTNVYEVLKGRALDNEFFSIIRTLVLAWAGDTPAESPQDLFSHYGFSAAQRDFLERWVKVELRLVEE